MVPSVEVRTVPDFPTVTNVLFPNLTPLRCSVVPEVLEVQVVPSVEVRIVPRFPTVTNVLFP